MKKYLVLIFILMIVFPLIGNSCFAQDTLIRKEIEKHPKIRIDLDFPFLFSGSGSVAIRFFRKNYIGTRVGLGGTYLYPLKKIPDTTIPFYWEFAKIDIFHKIELNKNIELDNGIRGAVLIFPTDENGGGMARIGLYTQPMIGWAHLKFGVLLFFSLNETISPIYLSPLCLRLTFTI